MKSQFGMCVYGGHPDIITSTESRSNSGIRMNHVASSIYDSDIYVEPEIDIQTQIKEFFTVEYLGTKCSPRWGGCRCGKCAVGNGNYSIKEER